MYAGLQSTAARMITKFGVNRELVKQGGIEQIYDPVTGIKNRPPSNPLKFDVAAVILAISNKYEGKFAIQIGDAVALVAGGGYHAVWKLNIIPEQGDTLDGWTVVAVEPVKPGATTVIYRCHLRKQ